MGWQNREYARWSDEERRRYLGAGSSRSAPARGRRISAVQSAFLAVIVSLVLFLLGQVPVAHPLIPALHFKLPAPPHRHPTSAANLSSSVPGKIRLPRVGAVGSFLRLSGTLAAGEIGTVSVEGAYGRPPWRLLAAVPAANGSYVARIQLTRRGLLHLRITQPDGHRSVGRVRVVK